MEIMQAIKSYANNYLRVHILEMKYGRANAALCEHALIE